MRKQNTQQKVKAIAKEIEARKIPNIKNRIERRAAMIGCLNEEMAILRQENRNDYALIKRLQQLG